MGRRHGNGFPHAAGGECGEVAKPEWWNDEGLKALSARVLRAAPNEESALDMRAYVLSGACGQVSTAHCHHKTSDGRGPFFRLALASASTNTMSP